MHDWSREPGGDFDFVKAAAHQHQVHEMGPKVQGLKLTLTLTLTLTLNPNQVHEMDSKSKGAWAERTREFGKSVGGGCSIQ